MDGSHRHVLRRQCSEADAGAKGIFERADRWNWNMVQRNTHPAELDGVPGLLDVGALGTYNMRAALLRVFVLLTIGKL